MFRGMDFQILKVNGQDLSNATHEEAVEAFKNACEPIVVEVLRRGSNKEKMKSKLPAMVSIATQTEEDFYCFQRPPTPPPPIFPIHSGLYQPSSRRPVAFSPNTDMGLTDIEMAQFDLEDPFYDERPFDVEYEEIQLCRMTIEDKLGLTLCYGSLEDEVTDIYISEIDPTGIAGKDGRIREGDQILQINGVDCHNRDQAIQLFSQNGNDISLLVARPQQFDDGFMEEQNVVLDDLHMDLLEKHHHDNMQIMADMLARAHLDEEGGTTDTVSTENSNKLDKDSGVGRTDESTRNDESSGQENFDLDSLPPNVNMKYRRNCNHAREHHHSSDSFTSMDIKDHDIPSEDCDKFREALEHKCDSIENSPRKMACRKSSQGSIDNELALLNKEMEDIQIECQELVDAHKSKVQQNQKTESLRSPRIVPRMGTRLDYLKHVQLQEASEFILNRKDSQINKSSQISDKDKDTSTTSAYNTGESCRSTPLTLELNLASDDSERGFKNSMLCLAPPAVTVPSSSDTEKQTQTPTRANEFSSDDSRGKRSSSKENRKNQANNKNLKEQAQMDESIQDLYIRCADVMYTNHANLQHTMAVQQKLFQQQLDQKSRPYGHSKSQSSSKSQSFNSPTSQSNDDKIRVDSPKGSSNKNKVESPQGTSNPPSESGGQMEWVVKRRPDGTRYIARRPIRSKLLKERARRVAEERCGMTTDDDAMSELKVGRYWTKKKKVPTATLR